MPTRTSYPHGVEVEASSSNATETLGTVDGRGAPARGPAEVLPAGVEVGRYVVRERLGAVRPAMARLRAVLPRPSESADARSRHFVELAAADVQRALVQARRSVRALVGELAELEAEGRDLIAGASVATGGERAER